MSTLSDAEVDTAPVTLSKRQIEQLRNDMTTAARQMCDKVK
jgi:hypothetical protein